MRNILKMLFVLRQERPKVGAANVFRFIQMGERTSLWAEKFFEHSSWLLIAGVLLITLLPLPNGKFLEVKVIVIISFVYAAYVLFLEFASRAFKSAYDDAPFHVLRITVNIIFISTLIWFSSGEDSYFWFFYSLPIFQAIIYLRPKGILFVTAAILTAYSTISALTTVRLNEPLDFRVLLTNGMVLSVLGFALYWIFASVKRSTVLHQEELEALRLTTLDIMGQLDTSNLLNMIIQRAAFLLHAKGGGIYKYDPFRQELEIVAEWGSNKSIIGKKLKVGEGMAGVVVKTGEHLIVDNYATWRNRSENYEPYVFRAVIEVPLYANGEIIGVLYVTDNEIGRVFNLRDAQLLKLFASYAAVAIGNSKIFAKREVIYRLNEYINSALNLEEVLHVTLREGLRAVRADEGSIMIKNPLTNEIEFKAWMIGSEFVDVPKRKFAVGEGIAGWVAQTGKPYNCPDTAKDDHFVSAFTVRNIHSILSVPITSHNQVLFIINADSETLNFFNEDDSHFLLTLAEHVTVAIGTHRLREISQGLTTLSLSDLLVKIVESACILTGAEASTIILVNEKSDRLERVAQFPAFRGQREGPRKAGLTNEIINEGKPIVILDAQRDDRVKETVKEESVQALIGVPLKILVQGSVFKVIGVLWVNTTQSIKFSNRDVDLLQVLASQATIAIQNARLFEDTLQHARAVEDLYKTSLEVTEDYHIPRIVASIIERAVTLLQVEGGGIYLTDKPYKDFKLTDARNMPEKYIGKSFPIKSGVIGKTIIERRPYSVTDYSNWPDKIDEYDELGLLSVAGAPIIWQKKTWGAIAVHTTRNRRVFSQEDLKLLGNLAGLAAVTLENARRKDEMERIMNSVFDAVIIIDNGGTVTKFNQHAETILGYGQEILDQDIRLLYLDNEARRIKRMLLESEDGRITDEHTFALSKSGEKIPILISASLLYNHEGEQAGSIGFFRDMREMKSVKSHINLLKSLLSASRITDSPENLSVKLQAILYEARNALTGVDAITLYLYDPVTQQISLPPIYDGVWHTDIWRDPIRKDSPVIKAIHAGEIQFIENATSDHLTRGEFVTREDIKSCVAAPLNLGESILGVLFLNYRSQHYFSAEEKHAISIFAHQAAIVIENAKLYRLTTKRLIESQTLQQVCVSLPRRSEPRAILETVVHAVIQLTDADESSILLYDRHRDEFVEALTCTGMDKPLEEYKSQVKERTDLAFTIIDTQEAVSIENSTTDQRVSPKAIEKGRLAIIGVPLPASDGSIGVLYANWKKPRKFTDELQLLSALAAEGAAAIESAKLQAETRRELKRINLIHKVATAASSFVLEEVLAGIVNTLVEELDYESVDIRMIDYQNKVLNRSYFGGLLSQCSVGADIPLGVGITGLVALKGEAVRIPDVSKDDQYLRGNPKTKSEMCAPIKVGSKPIAVINVESEELNAFSPSDLQILTTVASHVAKILENALQIKAITDIGRVINSSLDREKTLNTILTSIRPIIDYVSAEITLWDSEIEGNLVVGSAGDPSYTERANGIYPLNTGYTGRIINTNQSLLIPDAFKQTDPLPKVDHPYRPIRSFVGVPLQVMDRCPGTLELISNVPNAFDKHDQEVLLMLGAFAEVAIKNSEQVKKVARAARVSALMAWGAELAHDLNSEMGAIRRTLYILLQRDDLPIEVRERLRLADNYAEALVFPSRSSSASYAYLQDVVEYQLSSARKLWPNISWETDPSSNAAQVQMNNWWLGRCIRHLLRNAATNMPPDKDQKRITIRTLHDNSFAYIQVEDNGMGLPKEVVPLVFEQAIKRGGSGGAGLLIVAWTLEWHGGSARVLWNRHGEGVCFELRVPLVPCE
jgi:PAS domain S-box-containing protein